MRAAKRWCSPTSICLGPSRSVSAARARELFLVVIEALWRGANRGAGRECEAARVGEAEAGVSGGASGEGFGDGGGDLVGPYVVGGQSFVDRSDPAGCGRVGVTGVAEPGRVYAQDRYR